MMHPKPGVAGMPTAAASESAAASVDALASAVVRLLLSDDDARGALADLAGRVIAVELRGTPVVIYLYPTATGVKLRQAHEGEPDVRIAVRLRDLLAVARAHRSGDGVAAGQVDIRGDLATAQQVQAILRGLDLDWEEVLSRYLGDLAAHQLGRAARVFAGWLGDAGTLFEQDLSEYLQREIALLPTRTEHDAFLDQASLLTSEVERVGARVGRLRAKLGQT